VTSCASSSAEVSRADEAIKNFSVYTDQHLASASAWLGDESLDRESGRLLKKVSCDSFSNESLTVQCSAKLSLCACTFVL
jgi:hypothetical protein